MSENIRIAALEEVIERAMTSHYDLVMCRCQLCEAGRNLGLHARSCYPMTLGYTDHPVQEKQT